MATWVMSTKCWGYTDAWAADDDVTASMDKLKLYLEQRGATVVTDEAKDLRAMRIENFSRNQQVMADLRAGDIGTVRVKKAVVPEGVR